MICSLNCIYVLRPKTMRHKVTENKKGCVILCAILPICSLVIFRHICQISDDHLIYLIDSNIDEKSFNNQIKKKKTEMMLLCEMKKLYFLTNESCLMAGQGVALARSKLAEFSFLAVSLLWAGAYHKRLSHHLLIHFNSCCSCKAGYDILLTKTILDLA